MSDRIERLLLAAQEDIDTLGSELEIAERERDRYRAALERIVALWTDPAPAQRQDVAYQAAVRFASEALRS